MTTKLGASGSDLGVLSSVYAAMQLVCAPLWGTLSDRIGRKPVLLIGLGISFLVKSSASTALAKTPLEY
jgi:MFS transporter, DHA1 family, multidrug resistance protein